MQYGDFYRRQKAGRMRSVCQNFACSGSAWLFWVLLCLELALSSLAHAVPWDISVSNQNGLPSISIGGISTTSSQFVFWGKNWKWADFPARVNVRAPFKYDISGKNSELNFDLKGQAEKISSRQMVWTFNFEAHSDEPGVIGGGISFKFDLARFSSYFGEPELLPGNQGWLWGKGRDQIEMRFDPPPPAVYFERNQRSEVRVFFYTGEVPQGHRHYTATLTISGDITFAPTVAERFGTENSGEWSTNILNWPIAPWTIAPVDLSFLNASERPAGKHGFLQTRKDTLVFADGAPVRFWGTNLTSYALFGTDKEGVKVQARRLSQLGFNLVRFHHHDSVWVNPNIFGDARSPDTRYLSPATLDKLDWWIKCLKDEGIYVWLDLEVGRNFKRADGIEHFEEMSRGKPTASLKGFNYVNDSIEQAMRQFNEAYVNHLNPYTALRYKDDPAIAAMLLNNENDVTNHFGNQLLPDKHVPWHNGLYMARAAAFAEKYDLPKDKVWTSWLPGPSKIFLNDLEQQFNAQMINQLRALGVRVPIVTTSTWGNSPLSSLPALTNGDIIDVHSYGGVNELQKNPIYGPNLASWLAAAQVVDRPLSVTEWNVEPFPVADRAVIPLYIAGSASLQGWDALMQYAYSQQPLTNRGRPGNWEAFNDPAMMATLPAAALLFRRNDVTEAKTTYVFAPDSQQLFDQVISPANSVALRTAVEKGKLMIALPQTAQLSWFKKSEIPAGAKVITDPNETLISRDAKESVSDTGEIRHDWEDGIYTINTPRTQAAMGWIGGKDIVLASIDIKVSTSNAVVAVQSLDSKPITESGELLISVAARSLPSQGGQLPFRSEPVTGELTIRARNGLHLYSQYFPSKRDNKIPFFYKNGSYHIALRPNIDTYWLFLKP